MKPIIAVPATLALIYRAWSHKSLTPLGIFFAALTAIAHAVHPWSLPFTLLCVFFLAGTRVTKVKKDIKEQLTVKADGGTGGEGPRTHVQVLANSAVASVLCLVHAYQLHQRPVDQRDAQCYTWGGDLLIVGIIANYAAVAADTFSSELGILSKSQPRLITSPTLRKVPKGTNGGVTIWGLEAGLLGAFIIAITSTLLTPLCGVRSHAETLSSTPDNGLAGGQGWGLQEKAYFTLAVTVWGGLGSLLDSFLGGWLQQSVRDSRSGLIVEGEGGQRVLVSHSGPKSMHFNARAEAKEKILGRHAQDAVPKTHREEEVEKILDKKMGGPDRYNANKKFRQASFGDGVPTRVVESGLALLDNNDVNFLMALIMSLGGMAVAAWYWEVPLQSTIPF